MDENRDEFVVYMANKGDWQPLELSPVLAKFRKVPIMDSAREVRHARGVFRSLASEDEARALEAALAGAGFAARVAAASDLPRLPPVEVLAHASPRDDALVIQTRRGEERRIAWDRVELVAVAPFSTTVYEKIKKDPGPGAGEIAAKFAGAALTGIPVRIGAPRRDPKPVAKTEFHLVLDLVLRDPDERVRVDASKFDFSGLGDDMTYMGFANLKILLAYVVTHAEGTLTSLGADLLLDGGRLTSLGYASLEDFELEERWLLATLSL